MRVRSQYYGWFDPKTRVFRLSKYPPDAPVRPSLAFSKRADLIAVVDRKRGNLMWWPPLTQEQMSDRPMAW